MLAVDAALLQRGTITLGTAYLLFQYTQILRAPLGELADETERVQRAGGGMIRTLQLLDETSTIADTGTASLPDGALGLELDSLTFHYADEDEPARVVDTLTAAGLAPRRRGDRVYFDDPDGIEVQVAARTHGV